MLCELYFTIENQWVIVSNDEAQKTQTCIFYEAIYIYIYIKYVFIRKYGARLYPQHM